MKQVRRFSHIMVLGLPTSAADPRMHVLVIRVKDGYKALERAYDPHEYGLDSDAMTDAADRDIAVAVPDPLERDALWQVARQVCSQGRDWREVTVTAHIGAISWTDQVA